MYFLWFFFPYKVSLKSCLIFAELLIPKAQGEWSAVMWLDCVKNEEGYETFPRWKIGLQHETGTNMATRFENCRDLLNYVWHIKSD